MYHARDYLDFILDPSAGAAKEEHDDKYAQYGIEEVNAYPYTLGSGDLTVAQ